MWIFSYSTIKPNDEAMRVLTYHELFFIPSNLRQTIILPSYGRLLDWIVDGNICYLTQDDEEKMVSTDNNQTILCFSPLMVGFYELQRLAVRLFS